MATRPTHSSGPPGFVAGGGSGQRAKEASDHKPRSTAQAADDGTLSMVVFRPLGPDVSENEFKERLEMIASDLHRLLQLETQDFWSMVNFDKSILRSLDSYLRFSPRHWFEFEKLGLDGDASDLLQTVSRLVFLVLLRLATNKDTGHGKKREAFLSSSEFGRLIYDRRIWSIPMLFDTVAIYGRKNGAVLSKMIESMFNAQPKFADDLAGAISTTESRLIQMASDLDQMFLVKSNDHAGLMSTLADMVLFAFDTFSTLETLVNLYPAAALVINQSSTFLPYCAEFAESTLQNLIHQIANLTFKTAGEELYFLDGETVLKIGAATEVRIANTFHALLSATCLQPPEHIHPEHFFSVLTTVAGHRRFLWILDQLHPVSSDVVLLERHADSRHTDLSCRDYVLSAVDEARRHNQSASGNKKQKSKSPPLAGAASGGPSKADIDSMVNSVRNVMGDLDRKFVAKCLVRFDYNADALVQAMLDDNLPPDLRQDGAGLTSDNEEEDTHNSDDDYEYTSENIEAALTSVHIGKRDVVLESDELKDMKSFYTKFATVVTTVDAPATNANQPVAIAPPAYVSVSHPDMFQDYYEDEYDDTYDDNEGAVGPQGSAGDELLRRRGFTVPRVLTKGVKKEPAFNEESSGSDEEEEEAIEQQPYNARGMGAGRGGRGGFQGNNRGRGGYSSAGPRPGGPADQENANERLGPRTGDTRGFKGASRDRQKLETAAAKGGGGGNFYSQNQRPRSDNNSSQRGARGYNNDRQARPLEAEGHNRGGEEREEREHQNQRNSDTQQQEQKELPEDAARQKKERNKGNVGNHNRRDLAARKRREF